MIATLLGCSLYYCSNKYKRLRTRTGTLRYCEVNLLATAPVLNSLLGTFVTLLTLYLLVLNWSLPSGVIVL